MSTIGHVTRKGNGFEGHLRTLTIDVPISVVANSDKAQPEQPDYRIFSRGNVEVGAGWVRQNRTDGSSYVSLAFEAPEIGRLYANLGQAAGQDDPDMFAIIWNSESATRH